MKNMSNYFRGLNNYQDDFEMYLRYLILWLYKDYGTTILVLTVAPAVSTPVLLWPS